MQQIADDLHAGGFRLFRLRRGFRKLEEVHAERAELLLCRCDFESSVGKDLFWVFYFKRRLDILRRHRAERHADGAAALPPQEICHPVVDSSRGERMECSAIRPVSGDRVVEGDHRLRAGIVAAVHEASGGAGRAAADKIHILFDQPLPRSRIPLRKRYLVFQRHILTAFFQNCVYHSISAAKIAPPPYQIEYEGTV